MQKQRVLIIQEHLPHYRVRFYELLREELGAKNIELQLVYDPNTASNLLAGNLDWATARPIRWIGKFGWQRVADLAAAADLVVIQQEVKYISNLWLILRRKFRSQAKIALWGHGRNFQATNPNSLAERFKRHVSKKVDWWFAYNNLSVKVVEALGFPKEKITSVGNAIDTKKLMRLRAALGDEEITRVRQELRMQGKKVGLFTGGMYEEKRIPFLLEACREIHSQCPEFAMIFIGKGPMAGLVEEAALQNPWMHYAGALDDEQKIRYWAVADVLLMPGLVGLVVLDSFALGVPMVTTAYPYHSPEMDYLKNGENGILVEDWESVSGYAHAVVKLLRSPEVIDHLAESGKKAAGIFTVENMAENFYSGILSALEMKL